MASKVVKRRNMISIGRTGGLGEGRGQKLVDAPQKRKMKGEDRGGKNSVRGRTKRSQSITRPQTIRGLAVEK